MLSIETQQVRPVVVSEYAAFGAECVRNGEYVFLDGRLYSAMSTDARSRAEVPFSQFIDVRPQAGGRPNTPVLHVRRDDISFAPAFTLHNAMGLRTASDGSVYAEVSGQALDLESILPAKRSAVIQRGVNYSLVRDRVRITYVNPNSRRLPPGPSFPVYGFSAPEIWGMGSYDCSTGRPGCSSSQSGPAVGYYLYSIINEGQKRLHVVFTIAPHRDPLVQRWPVVARSGAGSSLVVSGVALDAKRCYVLLEPSPGRAENRVNGRLKLDLYVAGCSFSAKELQYDQPQRVGQKQASFTVPSLSLHGDFAVITESTDLASQGHDQIEFEKAAVARANVCARFLRTSSSPLALVNTICVRLWPNGAIELKVSPDGGYVDIRSETNPVIVGREYRNDGTGPDWLNHGEQQ
jgi:hypothetical protein